jgi:hypothetical protein
MMILLLFLQKQNLASDIYLLVLGTGLFFDRCALIGNEMPGGRL